MKRVTNLFFTPSRVRLPLAWVGLGQETRQAADYRWHGLKRGGTPHLLWQCTLAGRGHIRIGDGPDRVLRAGDGFLALIPSDHVYFYRMGDPAWKFIWMMWTGPALVSIWESLNQTDVRLLRKRASSPEVGFVQSLLSRRKSGDFFTKTDAIDSYRLLLELCDREEKVSSSRPHARIAGRLERETRRRPNASIGKDGLAAAFSLSRFQFYRALRQETGLSPKDWIVRRRLDRACRLLRETQKPIAEIAVEVGVPDANYFARLFRKRIGFTPRAWRRLFLAG